MDRLAARRFVASKNDAGRSNVDDGGVVAEKREPHPLVYLLLQHYLESIDVTKYRVGSLHHLYCLMIVMMKARVYLLVPALFQ